MFVYPFPLAVSILDFLKYHLFTFLFIFVLFCFLLLPRLFRFPLSIPLSLLSSSPISLFRFFLLLCLSLVPTLMQPRETSNLKSSFKFDYDTQTRMKTAKNNEWINKTKRQKTFYFFIIILFSPLFTILICLLARQSKYFDLHVRHFLWCFLHKFRFMLYLRHLWISFLSFSFSSRFISLFTGPLFVFTHIYPFT